jgi:predicted transglutaminase-like cysteine proteinase
MGKQGKRVSTGLALVITAAAALAAGMSGTQAGERLAYNNVGHERIVYADVGAATRAPIGWVEFCVEYKPECETKPVEPRDIVLTPKVWADLVKVDLWVNTHVKPLTDMDHWGVVERWNYPDDGYGDCEDYVLQKRRMLLRAGWPRSALLITVVRDQKNEGHAVLTVKTNRGEYILDNQRDEILPWNKTGYHFVKRQSQSDPNTWVSLGVPRAAPAMVSAH